MTKILAIIAALRESVALINKLISMYESWRDARIEKKVQKRKDKRDAIIKQIELETDDDKLRELHRRLRAIDSE